MKGNQKSIRAQLIKLILIVSSLSLLVAFAVLLAHEITSYNQYAARHLEVLADMVAQNSTAALAFDNRREGERS